MKDWVKKFKEAAERQGDVESHIQLAKILIHGSKSITADPQQAVYWLDRASRKSAEAAFMLAKLYRKGKYLAQDRQAAYNYYRKAMLLRPCECGSQREAIHRQLIASPQPCYFAEATEGIRLLDLTEDEQSAFDKHFLTPPAAHRPSFV